MKKAALLLTVGLFCAVAQAYIPPYWMIVSRVTDNHGTGFYKLDMDVIFNHGSEPKVVNERWFVLDEDNMRVEISGKKGFDQPFTATFIYNRGNKSYLDESGKLKKAGVGKYFFEPLFHSRSSKDFKQRLILAGLVSKETLKSVSNSFDAKAYEEQKSQAKATEEKAEYVKLGRMDGLVSYKVTASNEAQSPGIWIEQDQFVIQKLLYPNGVSVNAKDYSGSNGLEFPQNREVRWEKANAYIRLNSSTSLSKTPKNKALVSTSSLKDEKSTLPQDEVIRNFYSEFR